MVARFQLRVALESDDVGAAWFDDLALAVEPPPPVDDTPPQVAITAPADGATVSGVFTITADASDDGEVAGVQFQVDGERRRERRSRLRRTAVDLNSYTLGERDRTC